MSNNQIFVTARDSAVDSLAIKNVLMCFSDQSDGVCLQAIVWCNQLASKLASMLLSLPHPDPAPATYDSPTNSTPDTSSTTDEAHIDAKAVLQHARQYLLSGVTLISKVGSESIIDGLLSVEGVKRCTDAAWPTVEELAAAEMVTEITWSVTAARTGSTIPR